jgi:glycopeptide antibiotics resistance protein
MSQTAATSPAGTGLRWGAGVLLGVYALLIGRLTLATASSETGIFGLLDRVSSHASNGRLDWSQTEVLANVALFVPAGFLLTIVLGRAWASAVLCVLASAAIELIQQRYLPSRVPSLADVEHNGLGGLIGALLGWPVAHVIRHQARHLTNRPAMIRSDTSW